MQYSSGYLRAPWQGIKTMDCINQCVEDSDLNTFFCNSFFCNSFFTHFERFDFSENVSMPRGSLVPLNDIVISQECVTAYS